jgi:hypothetical protein
MSFRMCDFITATATETKVAKAQNGSRPTTKQRSRRFETLSAHTSNAARRTLSPVACGTLPLGFC